MVESSSENVNLDTGKDFNLERFKNQLRTLAAKPDELDIAVWSNMLFEVTNLFKELGKFMSTAFSGKSMNFKI